MILYHLHKPFSKKNQVKIIKVVSVSQTLFLRRWTSALYRVFGVGVNTQDALRICFLVLF